jgi:hypothetical protein
MYDSYYLGKYNRKKYIKSKMFSLDIFTKTHVKNI